MAMAACAGIHRGLRVESGACRLLQVFSHGQQKRRSTKPVAGIAMMGGGSDLDEAFAWLCHRGKWRRFLDPARDRR
jgi:hypothetical protein